MVIMSSNELRSVLRYPGSKWRLAKKICGMIPEHKSYLEPYFGSGAVFFTKPPSRIETINDLDMDVVNLFACLRKNPAELPTDDYVGCGFCEAVKRLDGRPLAHDPL